MVSITITLDGELKAKVDKLSWVNWSDVVRDDSMKKAIFERFIKTGTLSSEDQEFCDKIGWYPVDELELKEEYVEKLKRIEKGPHSKPMTPKELDNWFDEL